MSEPPRPACPQCGNEHVRISGWSDNVSRTVRRYNCPCGFVFRDPAAPALRGGNPACPRCRSPRRVQKRGLLKDGARNFECKNCRRRFRDPAAPPPAPPVQRRGPQLRDPRPLTVVLSAALFRSLVDMYDVRRDFGAIPNLDRFAADLIESEVASFRALHRPTYEADPGAQLVAATVRGLQDGNGNGHHYGGSRPARSPLDRRVRLSPETRKRIVILATEQNLGAATIARRVAVSAKHVREVVREATRESQMDA